MSASPTPQAATRQAPATRKQPLHGVAAKAHKALSRIAGGVLLRQPVNVRFWDGSELRSRDGSGATLVVRDPVALAYWAYAPGQLGLARAWVTSKLAAQGDFEQLLSLRASLEELPLTKVDHARLALIALALAGRTALRPPPIPHSEARQRGRLHSLIRDRHAIGHHYDISNGFYRLLLGPSMVYSCAYFASPRDTLEQAQERKLEAICAKLALRPGERLLDIGCGWGSLLLHAAEHHRVRGVGVTLSEAQAELARSRVREAGVSDEIEIRIADYRQLADGPYDKIASIGMYEHVGLAQYRAYAHKVRSLLKPGGLFLNDGVARLHAAFARRPSFINRYVFPDGELHPLSALIGSVEQAGMETRQVESWREHYEHTLRCWHSNLIANREAMEAEVGAERTRVWELYTLACALGFRSGEITNYQVLAER
jgi:cyclopropane-fatty-acyl-phospholipid synthase